MELCLSLLSPSLSLLLPFLTPLSPSFLSLSYSLPATHPLFPYFPSPSYFPISYSLAVLPLTGQTETQVVTCLGSISSYATGCYLKFATVGSDNLRQMSEYPIPHGEHCILAP
jgi:hypothetical protein